MMELRLKGEMMELRELLQGKLGWIETTRGQTHVNVKLSQEDLAYLVALMTPDFRIGDPDLPMIAPHLIRNPLTNCA